MRRSFPPEEVCYGYSSVEPVRRSVILSKDDAVYVIAITNDGMASANLTDLSNTLSTVFFGSKSVAKGP